MPKFDAGAVVDPLDYDFTTVKGYPHRKARGIIPEPTDEQIATFLGRQREVMNQAKAMAEGVDVDPNDPMAFLKQLDSFDPSKFLDMFHAMSDAYAELCSGQPSSEEISALPMRVRVHFFAWVQTEVVSPEAGTGAGTAAVIPLRSQAAG